MKPLLRAVLVVDTLLYLAVGVLYLLTPWTSLYSMLRLTVIEPHLAGQLLGLALIGLAWLSLHGVTNGAMTAGVANVVGHVTWLAGFLLLIWLIGLHTSLSPDNGVLLNALAGVVLLVVGMGGVRLSHAVRRSEKAAAAAIQVRSGGQAAGVARPDPAAAGDLPGGPRPPLHG